MKINLPNVTLLGIDCLDIDRLIEVSAICEDEATFGDVKLLSSQERPGNKRVVKIPHLSYIDISRFIIKDLYRFVSTDFVLIIQHDGFILNSSAWLDTFLNYDYIGAPWWFHDAHNVGNGGFSLRSRRLCEMTARDERIVEFHAEDFKIGRTYRHYLEEQGAKFAPEYLAKRFSFEGSLKRGLKWNGEFGFHNFIKTDLSNCDLLTTLDRKQHKDFLARYSKIREQRTQVRVDMEILEGYAGHFRATDKACNANVHIRNGKLMLRVHDTDIEYYAFNQWFFFSDEKENILEFKPYKSFLFLIIYTKENASFMRSRCLRKTTGVNC